MKDVMGDEANGIKWVNGRFLADIDYADSGNVAIIQGLLGR